MTNVISTTFPNICQFVSSLSTLFVFRMRNSLAKKDRVPDVCPLTDNSRKELPRRACESE